MGSSQEAFIHFVMAFVNLAGEVCTGIPKELVKVFVIESALESTLESAVVLDK